jgi:phosphate transport system permease protein
MLVGTLLATAGAVAVATPLGICSALFCHFYAPPPLAWAYRRLVELLAGVPSVVYGFWGLVVLVPLIARWQPPGASLLAGSAILAIMVLPTMALVADAALANVPRAYLHGAAALGLSRWGTIRRVVLPAARGGLLTGVILETGRAIGETMAVLMVCGNVVQMPRSLFDPVRTLTANIALELAYALGDHRSALFVSGLLLMAMVGLLVAAAELVSKERADG